MTKAFRNHIPCLSILLNILSKIEFDLLANKPPFFLVSVYSVYA